MSHVDYKKGLCCPVEFKKHPCCPVESKKHPCRPVKFKKHPCRMLLKGGFHVATNFGKNRTIFSATKKLGNETLCRPKSVCLSPTIILLLR